MHVTKNLTIKMRYAICILVKEELLSNQGMASHTFKRRGLAEFNQLQIQVLFNSNYDDKTRFEETNDDNHKMIVNQ